MRTRSFFLTVVAVSAFALLPTPAEAGGKRHYQRGWNNYGYYHRGWDNYGYRPARYYRPVYYYHAPRYRRVYYNPAPVVAIRFGFWR